MQAAANTTNTNTTAEEANKLRQAQNDAWLTVITSLGFGEG